MSKKSFASLTAPGLFRLVKAGIKPLKFFAVRNRFAGRSQGTHMVIPKEVGRFGSVGLGVSSQIITLSNPEMIPEFEQILTRENTWNWERQTPTDLPRVIRDTVEYLRRHGVVYITHHISRSEWDEFCGQTEHEGLSGVIMVDALPSAWPRPAGCTVADGLHRIVSRNLDLWHRYRGDLRPPAWRRQSDQIPYSFFSAQGSVDPSRTLINRLLHILGVDRSALTSTPAIPAHSLMITPDPWQLNPHLGAPVPARRFDDQPVLRVDQRKKMVWEYSVADLNQVIAAMQRCHFVLAQDNHWMRPDNNGAVTEKMLLPCLTGVPVVWLAQSAKRDLLEGWGFRDSSRGVPGESAGDPLAWVSHISLLERLVQDSPAAQSWQDAQGERVYHNYQNLWRLRDRLNEAQWQQWQRIRHRI